MGEDPSQSPWRCETKADEEWEEGGEDQQGRGGMPYCGRRWSRRRHTSWRQDMEGHQKRCWMRPRVRSAPGWQAIVESCPNWSTEDLACGGTNSRPGGQPSGAGWSSCASRTTLSTSHLATPTTQEDGRMVPADGSSTGGAN
ncbi:hypothetical protein CgunFtcFv8_013741 [Champsocephalus gunnari]|uniref:Uncharacterized protein n=1 Tax=Champsocephalus gunnari TaxID=52237 RepID=A0AAN8HYL1_CHAGU|nr:hypothetical protein CgunFtcFv8_013741 [Champsocephalus gunnari]